MEKDLQKTFCLSCHFLYTELENLTDPQLNFINGAPSSEFVSSSIPSWQIVTAHAQPFRGTRDLAFCLKVPLDWMLIWASSRGSGETARMRRLACTFAARMGDKYQIRLTRPNYWCHVHILFSLGKLSVLGQLYQIWKWLLLLISDLLLSKND